MFARHSSCISLVLHKLYFISYTVYTWNKLWYNYRIPAFSERHGSERVELCIYILFLVLLFWFQSWPWLVCGSYTLLCFTHVPGKFYCGPLLLNVLFLLFHVQTLSFRLWIWVILVYYRLPVDLNPLPNCIWERLLNLSKKISHSFKHLHTAFNFRIIQWPVPAVIHLHLPLSGSDSWGVKTCKEVA